MFKKNPTDISHLQRITKNIQQTKTTPAGLSISPVSKLRQTGQGLL